MILLDLMQNVTSTGRRSGSQPPSRRSGVIRTSTITTWSRHARRCTTPAWSLS